jgi:small-conductance mechanosensitive channel
MLNFFGLLIRPIKVGDVIQIDADIGEVRRIGIRACVIFVNYSY